MDIEIITIGDELLIGQVVDTNSAWIAKELNKIGFRVVQKVTVGDTESAIIEAIEAASRRVNLALLTGGLGPTKDDITLRSLCRYFGCSLHFSEEVFANIEQLFGFSGRSMNELTRMQAMVPDKATVIMNRVGTAPCTWFEKDNFTLVSMPGVPSEMKWLMSNEIIPRFKQRFPQQTIIAHRSYRITGFTESALALRIAEFENALPATLKLAYLPQGGSIVLRLSAYGAISDNELTLACARLEACLQGHILAADDSPLEQLVGNSLRAAGATVSIAESCTGGAIAAALTSVAGCSDYFLSSVVSYSNNVKMNVLGVKYETLKAHGAVSREVVEQMAYGVMQLTGSDYAVATSGIAGPGGGTLNKPVGTVWLAVANRKCITSKEFHFTTDRNENIRRTVNLALIMLNNELKL
jgi:nicotinamide-nucleotide amidase